ncbi:hypothetical protein KUL72_30910 [Bradyrhizobium arachidis]|uniref:hypothetical protein n=1 Tax=Bradyrhizobium arachidis TaxID=858423 RepID=UPI002162314C|nr:hypothetical protein [Bradyrhizobium arachidis]UVO35742.1 hypothetical protein KUL72_30910 [Bradyrhizobium arachidis]
MNTESSLNWPNPEPQAFVPTARRRWPLVLIVILVLFLAGVAGFYAWLNPGLFIQSAGRETTEVDTGSSDKAVMTDLLAAQQKTSDDVAAIDRAIADQQEQLKAIVEQLANLSSKIDDMKSPAPQAPLAPSVPSPMPTVGAPPASTTRVSPVTPAHIAPRQKGLPHATNPTGPISVGGAPLSTAPGTTAQ